MSPGYESWFLKASHPNRPQGVWIRYTTHRGADGAEVPSLWFTHFDPEPRAAKVTLGPESVSRGGGALVRFGDALLAPGRLSGRALQARWDLRFDSGEPDLRHLPAPLYRTPIPRTKLTTPFPAVRVSGEVGVGDTEVLLDRWPGVIGHNWGTQHAERWVWLHGGNFDGEDDDTWLDVALGRLRVGGRTSPWIANGAISIAGVRHRLGGLGRRGTVIEEHPDHCRFRLPGPGIVVEGLASAPREHFVGWVYADPDGSEHHVLNCSIATMSLAIGPRALHTDHGAAYELGTRDHDHGIPIQPFGDG